MKIKNVFTLLSILSIFIIFGCSPKVDISKEKIDSLKIVDYYIGGGAANQISLKTEIIGHSGNDKVDCSLKVNDEKKTIYNSPQPLGTTLIKTFLNTGVNVIEVCCSPSYNSEQVKCDSIKYDYKG